MPPTYQPVQPNTQQTYVPQQGYQQPAHAPPQGYPQQAPVEVVSAPPSHAQPLPPQPQHYQAPPPQQYQQPQPQQYQPAPQHAAQPSRAAGMGLFSTVNTEAVRASLDDAQSGDWVALKEGMNAFRILPPFNDGSGMVEPWVVAYVHRLEIPGNKRKYTYVCPKQMIGQPCPGCDDVARLRSSPNKVDQDLADERDAKAERYARAIDRQQAQVRIKLVRLSWKIYQHLANLLAPPSNMGSSGYAIAPRLFYDLFAGNDVVLIKRGEGLATTYPTIDLAASSPVLPGLEHPERVTNPDHNARAWAQLEQLVAEAPSIRDQLVVLSYDSIMQGMQAFLASAGRTNPMQVSGPPPVPWNGLQAPTQGQHPTSVIDNLGQVSGAQRPY